MVFIKRLKDLKFQDIERLETDKICESQILDYKEQMISDNKLIKHISAFANTEGGIPKEIIGIDKKRV
ncbi:MAG: helix-turn-helix domain-containing protein [Thermoproteota archaeon]